MTRVYGGCIEPEGRELDDYTYSADCPQCRKPAKYRAWEAAEGGSINTYNSVSCPHCGHYETDADPDFC